MFSKVLIANRGAIACRIARTLRRMGVGSVGVYSDADRHSRHVAMADEAVRLGPAPAAQSYLDIPAILAAARATGAEAIHPGYGFHSENAAFAQACADAGLVFIGPTPEHMRQLGPKHAARALARAEGLPLLPGTDLLPDVDAAQAAAAELGFPVMLKSTGGGGGIGMSLARTPAELATAFASVVRLAEANFKSGGVFLEKFVEQARHIEVQIFGDAHGHVVALGERDCSVQRRNQKVVEETPAPGLTPEQREELCRCAARLGQAVGYRSAGTVEFVYDNASAQFYFLEVNTRLQVEHGVTEEVTGVDLVEWMVRTAAGELDLRSWIPRPSGASIQVRVYAEDPQRNFQPAAGTLSEVYFPSSIRVETWVESGDEVSPYYDPMLAKIIAWGRDRAEALARLGAALADTRIYGLETNLSYLRQIVGSAGFGEGGVTTRFLTTLPYASAAVEVLEGGTQTTVQDYPGRIGYWAVGVPPSGPMDSRSFRLANRLVGNPDSAAGLEFTVQGPTLRFTRDSIVALTGAAMPVWLGERPAPYHRAFPVRAGQTLRCDTISGPGLRTYLAVRHGFDVPDYLGSKSTFTLGQFGGHAGRALRAGDTVRLRSSTPGGVADDAPLRRLPTGLVPQLTRDWSIGVVSGPHGAPDFFTNDDIATLVSTSYEVHYNSARTGVRLIGPKPTWARRDGGEAGLHPSNIHDNAYAVGAVDFTGDMPIILGPDGPSCGGFVCPFVVAQAELWKVGQLKPGDKVRFVPVAAGVSRTWAMAQEAELEQLRAVRSGAAHSTKQNLPIPRVESPILHQRAERPGIPAVVYRRAGDAYLLVEYGETRLDLALRLRVHALQTWLERQQLAPVLDLTPGIRSLQIHFDFRALPTERLLDLLLRAESELPPVEDLAVPSRIVHLPLSWEDESTLLAIRKYMQIVRKDAPWCPSNLEFIRRINGLDTLEDVRRICFDARWLVLALGDVYLGAPVATPLDPRHRLVTTKYNPARTWTPENAVGIGGAYLCVYGMEGPGGYQFIGRTCQMWNRYRTTPDFSEGKPWLLRFFDQIQFYPVSHAELLRFREDFPQGKVRLRIEETTFRLRDHQAFLAENAAEIQAFTHRRQAAFEAELRRWEASGQLNFSAADEASAPPAEEAIPAGCIALPAHIPGNVWKVRVGLGDRIEASTPLIVLESMKMEVSVTAPRAGVIREIRCAEGRPVHAGETLIVLEPT